MKETVWLFYIGVIVLLSGAIATHWIPAPGIAMLGIGSVLTLATLVINTFQNRQNQVAVLATEVREALMEQNSRFNGLKDMVAGINGDHIRLQAEVDKLDLDQLKKFESRLQFVENVVNVRQVMVNGGGIALLKKDA